MRAKSEIKNMENMGNIGKVWCMIVPASARHRKLWDNVGMKYEHLVEFPKLDVAGSIPVARSNFFSSRSKKRLLAWVPKYLAPFSLQESRLIQALKRKSGIGNSHPCLIISALRKIPSSTLSPFLWCSKNPAKKGIETS